MTELGLNFTGKKLDALKTVLLAMILPNAITIIYSSKISNLFYFLPLKCFLGVISSLSIFFSTYLYFKYFFNQTSISGVGQFSFNTKILDHWRLILLSTSIGFISFLFLDVQRDLVKEISKYFFQGDLASTTLMICFIASSVLPGILISYLVFKDLTQCITVDGEHLKYEISFFKFLKNSVFITILKGTIIGIPIALQLQFGNNLVNAMSHPKYTFNLRLQYLNTTLKLIKLLLLALTIVGAPYAAIKFFEWLIAHTSIITKVNSTSSDNFKEDLLKNSETLKYTATILLTVLAILSALQLNSKFNSYKKDITKNNGLDKEIPRSIVHLECPHVSKGQSSMLTTSGVIIQDQGWIIANTNIISHGPNRESETTEPDCLALLQKQDRHLPLEMFHIKPFDVGELTNKYGLTLFKITGAYTNTSSHYINTNWRKNGNYPKKFPVYVEPSYCRNRTIHPNDFVRIYDYERKYDGVIIRSSLEGYLYTSASITLENLGSLALDRQGCIVGTPVTLNIDGSKPVAVIMPKNLYLSFLGELREKVNEL